MPYGHESRSRERASRDRASRDTGGSRRMSKSIVGSIEAARAAEAKARDVSAQEAAKRGSGIGFLQAIAKGLAPLAANALLPGGGFARDALSLAFGAMFGEGAKMAETEMGMPRFSISDLTKPSKSPSGVQFGGAGTGPERERVTAQSVTNGHKDGGEGARPRMAAAQPSAEPSVSAYSRPPETQPPGGLELPSAMPSASQRATIATFGAHGQSKYRDPQAFDYYKNIALRDLLDEGGNIIEGATLLPIEREYVQRMTGMLPGGIEDFIAQLA